MHWYAWSESQLTSSPESRRTPVFTSSRFLTRKPLPITTPWVSSRKKTIHRSLQKGRRSRPSQYQPFFPCSTGQGVATDTGALNASPNGFLQTGISSWWRPVIQSGGTSIWVPRFQVGRGTPSPSRCWNVSTVLQDLHNKISAAIFKRSLIVSEVARRQVNPIAKLCFANSYNGTSNRVGEDADVARLTNRVRTVFLWSNSNHHGK
jgi:hypothetical protein